MKLLRQVEYKPVYARLGEKYACDAAGEPVAFASSEYGAHALVLDGYPREELDKLVWEDAQILGNLPQREVVEAVTVSESQSLLGSRTSEAKKASSAENGKKGGRPRKEK